MIPDWRELINKLERHGLDAAEFVALLDWAQDAEAYTAILARAADTARQIFGNRIYIRGLIEISSYCRNDCFYCGLRRSNLQACRYRLSEEQILACCGCVQTAEYVQQGRFSRTGCTHNRDELSFVDRERHAT